MSKLPNIPKRFFQWYCKPSLQEQILGDLEEQFEEDVRKEGTIKAKMRFAWTVIRFLRRSIIKPLGGTQKLNYYGMLKNDFKTSLRVIKRDKLYSLINILGLSSGFIIAVLILFYVRYEQSYEQNNPLADHIVRITMDYLNGESLVDQDCETYHILGPMIKDQFPEVVDFTRAYRFGLGFEVNGKIFSEPTVYAVDPSFLEMFGYSLIHGDPQNVLVESGQLVFTESAAIKYFGTVDAVGEMVKINEKNSAVVAGIVSDSPSNTHFKFNILLSYASMKSTFDKREDPWNSNDTFTYLKLDQPTSYQHFKSNLANLSDKLRKEDYIPDERIVSEKIKDIHLYSDKSYEVEQNGSATLVFFLLSVALLVIVIAILNYINLSTAKAMDRAKEAGIRKVVGSTTFQLRIRFFVESILLNSIAGVLTLIVIFFITDHYKVLAKLPPELSIMADANTWYLLVLLMISSIFLSGVFPAVIMSSFKPLEVLKGKFSHSKNGILLRKTLVTVQFAIATFLLIQTFTANQQLRFMINKDLGMNTNKIVVVNAPPPEGQKKSIKAFKNSLINESSFLNVCLSNTVPGNSTASMSSTTNINLDKENKELKNNFYFYHIDSSFFPTMEMEIIAGNNFDKITNYEDPIIINETALRVWGISDPNEVINQKSTFWGRKNTIVGVVKDFHQLGVKSSHIPMIFHEYKPHHEPDFISIRLSKGSILKQIGTLESLYTNHFPNSPFKFYFLDQHYNMQYQADRQFQELFSILSGFAVLITVLGLFGLASFTIAKRTKEIGIRKVLGANISEIIRLLSKEFIYLVLISSIAAIPLTYFTIESWLNQYSFRINLSFWLFLLPIAFILILTFITVLTQTYQASTINPAISLKDE